MNRRALARRQIDEREPDGVSPSDPSWSRTRALIRAFNNSAVVDGRLLDAEPKAIEGSGLVFTAGAQRSIPHKLGRPARGFVEVADPDLPGSGTLTLVASAHPQGVTSEHFITVVSSRSGRTFIWVY